MMTFPSVNDRESRVSLVRSGGYFERGKGRVNREEAAAVIMEIKKRYKDPLRKRPVSGGSYLQYQSADADRRPASDGISERSGL